MKTLQKFSSVHASVHNHWTDTVGFIPTVNRIEYIHFFAAVRAVNMRLPEAKRIRVWLAQAPIDWSTIHTRAEQRRLSLGRDSYPVDLIDREIMAKSRKALLIYGQAHFTEASIMSPILGSALRVAHPGALYYISPYFGFNEVACDAAFEARAAHWPIPAVIAPLKGQGNLNRAWSDTEVRAFLLNAPAHLKLPFALGLFAAMQEGDMVNLTWSSYDGATPRWIASKNGEACMAPVGGS